MAPEIRGADILRRSCGVGVCHGVLHPLGRSCLQYLLLFGSKKLVGNWAGKDVLELCM